MIDRIDSILDRDRSTGVQALSWSDEAAIRIRNLSKQQHIVLLTPVVPQPTSSRMLSHADNEKMSPRSDPFECLGQTICTYTKKINHIPFVPSAGIGPLHRDMIANACAIVVVNAEPAAVDSSAMEASISSQRAFATAVAIESVRGITGAHLDDNPIPLVMLHCGTQDHSWPGQLKAAYCDYDIILHVKDYAFTALVEAGHALMEGPT